MDPYALNDDGTAKDAEAFRNALRADPTRMAALEKEEEVKRIVLGDDLHAFQELIKSVYQVRPCLRHQGTPLAASWAGSSSARASAAVLAAPRAGLKAVLVKHAPCAELRPLTLLPASAALSACLGDLASSAAGQRPTRRLRPLPRRPRRSAPSG
jgi:hypothetical protein